MVKKTTTPAKKTVASNKKAVSSRKKPAAKSSVKRPRKTPAKTAQKVDFYPNRMTVAVSVLAGTLLVLVTIIAVLGSHGY